MRYAHQSFAIFPLIRDEPKLFAGLADYSLARKLKDYTSPEVLVIDDIGLDRLEQLEFSPPPRPKRNDQPGSLCPIMANKIAIGIRKKF